MRDRPRGWNWQRASIIYRDQRPCRRHRSHCSFCYICGKHVYPGRYEHNSLHVDHVRGRSFDDDNLAVACGRCNQSKYEDTLELHLHRILGTHPGYRRITEEVLWRLRHLYCGGLWSGRVEVEDAGPRQLEAWLQNCCTYRGRDERLHGVTRPEAKRFAGTLIQAIEQQPGATRVRHTRWQHCG